MYPKAEFTSVPNLLSFLRLALVPVFLVLLLGDSPGWALAVLAFAGFTDWLDGYIARRFGMITQLGKVLDPMADRFYIFAALIGLTINGNIPAWLAVVIILRDVLLAVGYPISASHGYGPLPVHFLGKAGTFALLYALPLLLLADIWPMGAVVVLPLAWAFTYWGIGLYWLAGILYLKQLIDLVARGRNSSSNL
jgi:cardiolipin synthase (CMP-forming)